MDYTHYHAEGVKKGTNLPLREGGREGTRERGTPKLMPLAVDFPQVQLVN